MQLRMLGLVALGVCRRFARIERAITTESAPRKLVSFGQLGFNVRVVQPSAEKCGHRHCGSASQSRGRHAALSVLADSAVEHYRGSFKNKAMFTPLIVSALTLATSVHGTSDSRRGAHAMRDILYAVAAATGLIGTGFHIYNVGKKIGGFCWQNLFYQAPLGAPLAILLSGLVGFCSERVRDSRAGATPTIFESARRPHHGAVMGAGLLGTTGEAGLMHFRGAFHNPFMILPVTLRPSAPCC